MVVEDDQDVRTSLVQALEDEGYAVSAAENGQEALTLLRAATEILPRLILLDLMMPVLDGQGFLAEQSRDARLAQIPVLVLTASGNSPDGGGLSEAVKAAEAAGAPGFVEGVPWRKIPVLKKPFALERLLAMVTSMCAPVIKQNS
jgi:CheY-like chemotaxis protein